MKRILTYAFSVLLLCSCAKEHEQRPGSHGNEVSVNISTRSLDPSMTEVRIVVTDASSGQVLINEYPAHREPTGDYKLSVRTGALNFYVVLNEPASLTPQLDAVYANSALQALILARADLPLVESPDNSTVQTNLPAVGWTKALIRSSSAVPTAGEASVDGGSTWNNTIGIKLERLASKVTLALRKKTPQGSDNLILNKVTLVNIPRYAYLLQKAYDSQEFDSETVHETPLSFPGNTDSYTKVFTDFIAPEYIPADKADKNTALGLKLEVRYNRKNVEYYIPVRAHTAVEDYSIKRNNHYIIRATLATEGETIHMPEVTYQVADWSDANIDSDFVEETAITFSQRWETGTAIDGTDIRVGNNAYVDFYFTLSYPKGASWAATLTNNIDFMFDNADGAVSQGVTREGHEYRIRIKPRRETERHDVKTEFYITVNNGMGNTELNLPDESVGVRKRYTIIQVPN